MDIVFRRADNRDRAIAQQLVDRALRDYGLHVVLDVDDRDLTDLEQYYDAKGGAFEVIELGGAPVGVVSWRAGDGGVVELKKLYLLAEARGHGIGRRAVERVIAFARAVGARAIVLETAGRLTEAVALYRRMGFQPVSGADAGAFATLADQCDAAYRLELT